MTPGGGGGHGTSLYRTAVDDYSRSASPSAWLLNFTFDKDKFEEDLRQSREKTSLVTEDQSSKVVLRSL